MLFEGFADQITLICIVFHDEQSQRLALWIHFHCRPRLLSVPGNSRSATVMYDSQ
jgi:hypothetical protein